MICYWTDARQKGIYLFYIITKTLFYFKIFQHRTKAGLPRLCPFWRRRKGNLWSKMKQFHWLLCVAKNCDWSRKITPLSNKSVAPRGMKTYSESRIKLRNLQILREMLEKSSQFLSSEQPCEAKSLDVALKKSRSWKNTLRKLVVAVNLEAIWFEFWMKGASMTVAFFVFCGWWFSNQFDIVWRHILAVILSAVSCG